MPTISFVSGTPANTISDCNTSGVAESQSNKTAPTSMIRSLTESNPEVSKSRPHTSGMTPSLLYFPYNTIAFGPSFTSAVDRFTIVVQTDSRYDQSTNTTGDGPRSTRTPLM